MDENMATRLEVVRGATVRAGKGDYMKYLGGKRVVRGQVIKAKCYECNGYGESDQCFITTCPLYPFSPYRQKATTATFIRTDGVKQAKKGGSNV